MIRIPSIRMGASLAALICCAATPIAHAGIATRTAKMRLSAENFDFGFIPTSARVKHRYWVYSAGNDTLRISKVQPTCGCTTVPLPKDRIKPGDSVPLDVAFSSQNFLGKVHKIVTITSNAVDTDSLHQSTISFDANVGRPDSLITTQPQVIYMDTLGKENQTVTLFNSGDTPCRLILVSPPPEFLTLQLPTPAELPARGKSECVLRLGAKVPIGEYFGSFTLRFDGPTSHLVTVPIYGMGYFR